MTDTRQIWHEPQRKFFQDKTRNRFLLVGRRGGKTIGIVEDLLSSIPEMPSFTDIFYIGPTHQQSKELLWDILESRMGELGWHFKAKIADQTFQLSRARKIYLIGAEKIRRIRGHRNYRVYLDELAYYSKPLNEIWRAVRPTLTDVKGRAVASTTPDGKGSDAYNFYLETLSKKDWAQHSWTSRDNPFLPQEEILSAKNDLDELSYFQEYEAQWVSFEGLAYYQFKEAEHLKPCAQINDNLTIDITLDFNVNPTSLLVVQYDGTIPMIYFKKEYSLKNSSTTATVRQFCEDFKQYKDTNRIEVMGDATGKSRKSNTGRSDYYYIEEMLKSYGFNYSMKVPSDNPPIVDRVNHTNAWLKNANGISRVTIDPACRELINDFSAQGLEGRFPSDKNNMGHKADAAGYYISYKHLLNSRQKQTTIEL